MTKPTPAEQLGSCRAVPRELETAECAELRALLEHDGDAAAAFERVQQWDRVVRRALDDVVVPEGLAERLRAACSPAPSADGGVVEHRHFHGWLRRCRRWSPSRRGAVLALAGTLVIGFGIWLSRAEPEYFDQSICEEAVRLAEAASTGRWRRMQEAPLDTYPLPLALGALRPGRWQAVVGGSGVRTVVYDYGRVGSASVYLLASRQPPRVPRSASLPLDPRYVSGWYAAAWRQSDCAYVLAVDGSKDVYRELLRRSSPLAFRRIRHFS